MASFVDPVLARFAVASASVRTTLKTQRRKLSHRRHDRALRRHARRLDPIARARLALISGEAGPEVGTNSTVGREATQLFQREVDYANETLKGEIEKLQHRERLVPPAPVIDERSFAETLDREVKAELQTSSGGLAEARRYVVLANIEARAFGRANGLSREPASRSPALGLAVLFFVWALEMSFNYQYLRVAGGGTALQNFLLVAVASALNVSLGAGAGILGIKNTTHRLRSRRIAGYVIFSFFALLCGLLHLMLAHYRQALDEAQALVSSGRTIDYEALNQRLTDALLHLGSRVHAHPFGFMDDLNAQFMFAAGLLLALLAAIDADYLIGDRYPAYGKYGAEIRRAVARESEAIRGFWKRVDAVRARLEKRLARETEKARQRLRRVTEIVNGSLLASQHYEHTVDAIMLTALRNIRDLRAACGDLTGDPLPEEEALPNFRRESDLGLDHFVRLGEDAQQAFQTFEDDVLRIRSALTTHEIELRATIEEALAAVRADGESRALAEAKLRNIDVGF